MRFLEQRSGGGNAAVSMLVPKDGKCHAFLDASDVGKIRFQEPCFTWNVNKPCRGNRRKRSCEIFYLLVC